MVSPGGNRLWRFWPYLYQKKRHNMMSFEFFHNSRLIRRIQHNKIYKKYRDLTRDWTTDRLLDSRLLNHYTKLFSVLVWGYNWILFMHGWFCPIRLIHLIPRKSLHFEKTRLASRGGGNVFSRLSVRHLEPPLVPAPAPIHVGTHSSHPSTRMGTHMTCSNMFTWVLGTSKTCM